MRSPRTCLPLIYFVIAGSALLQAQGQRADYERAEKYLPWNIRKLVFEAEVLPNWIGHTNRFWYENVKPDRREFVLVDADHNTQTPAFDHSRLAAALSRAAGKPYSAVDLPFRSIDFIADGSAVAFDVEGTHWPVRLGPIYARRFLNQPSTSPVFRPMASGKPKSKITTSICETPPRVISFNSRLMAEKTGPTRPRCPIRVS